MNLDTCTTCKGFLPPRTSSCPNCGSTRRGLMVRLANGAFAAATGALTAVTLMACYGMPPCEEGDDKDGDGYFGGDCADGTDCDDDNPAIHPDADDPEGDDVDQDCDGYDGKGGAGGAGGAGGSGAQGGASSGGMGPGGQGGGGGPTGG